MKGSLSLLLFLTVSILLITSCGAASQAVTTANGTETQPVQTTSIAPPTTTQITETSIASNTGPAVFSLSGLTIEPREILTDELFAISVIVSNTGGNQGIYDAVLYIEEVMIDLTATKITSVDAITKSVAVAAGGSQVVVFDSLQLTDGLYTVAIGELKDYIEVGC